MDAPSFVERGQFRVVGVEDDANLIDEVDPGFYDLWMNQFMAGQPKIIDHSPDGFCYGAWFGTRGTDISVGRYLACMEVSPTTPLPDGWTARVVPAATWAVFDTTLRDVGDATEYALDVWLPASDYVYDDDKPRLDAMGPETTGPESPVTVWIPVVHKSEGHRSDRDQTNKQWRAAYLT